MKTKLVTKFETTSAEVHDSQEPADLVTNKDKVLYGDSAYTGEEVQSCIPKGAGNRIHEKAYRNRPLTESQKRSNTAKSEVRARVEHIFATMSMTMHGITVRTIGKARAHIQNGITNVTYNFLRYVYLAGHVRWVRKLITA
jgi:IS5 family transposase